MPQLTNGKHERFAQEFALSRSKARGARAAGFKSLTTLEANTMGASILARPEVAARITEIAQQALDMADINAQRVMLELGRIAFGDVRRVFNDRGELKPVHEIDDDTAGCISAIEFEDVTRGAGQNAVTVRVGKIKRWDKNPALNTLAKHFKLVGDEGDGVNALASALADRLNTARKRMDEPEPTPRPVVDSSAGDDYEDLT